jgi:hypothetical protein
MQEVKEAPSVVAQAAQAIEKAKPPIVSLSALQNVGLLF